MRVNTERDLRGVADAAWALRPTEPSGAGVTGHRLVGLWMNFMVWPAYVHRDGPTNLSQPLQLNPADLRMGM